jgi:hypothetical protein
MSVTVFRAPLFGRLPDLSFQPSQMIRQIQSVPSHTTTTHNIFYKPMQPTVGHLGFLGLY